VEKCVQNALVDAVVTAFHHPGEEGHGVQGRRAIFVILEQRFERLPALYKVGINIALTQLVDQDLEKLAPEIEVRNR